MRIRGALIPPAHLRWAAAGTGVVALAVLITALVGSSGLFGAAREDLGSRTRATVVAGVPCDRAGAAETVSFTVSGEDHRARFDGCGHTDGEPVDVTVPPGPPAEDLVVHAAEAAVGDSENGEDLAVLLLVLSGAAGATYTCLLRTPAGLLPGTREPPARGQATSSGGDSQVLHW